MNAPGDGSEKKPIMYFDENGNGPNYHVCADEKGSAGRVRMWLDRQTLVGITAEEKRVVERLIEECF